MRQSVLRFHAGSGKRCRMSLSTWKKQMSAIPTLKSILMWYARARWNDEFLWEVRYTIRNRRRLDGAFVVGVLVVNTQGGGRSGGGEPVNRYPCQYFACVSISLFVGCKCGIPSSSSHVYASVQLTSFSYIHARRPTGESARL